MGSHVAPHAGRMQRGAVAAAAVGLAAALIGAGTYAAWQSTQSATTGTLNAATVTATHVDTNGTTFSTGVTNLLPGDFLYRYADLTNTGSVSQAFSGAVSGSGVLTTTSGGVTIAVDSCSVAWTTLAGVSTCAGVTSPVLAAAGVSGSPSINYGTLAANGVSHLRYTFTLPSSASQTTFQGQSGTVTVAVTGTPTATQGADRTAG